MRNLQEVLTELKIIKKNLDALSQTRQSPVEFYVDYVSKQGTSVGPLKIALRF